jgi:Trypsin
LPTVGLARRSLGLALLLAAVALVAVPPTSASVRPRIIGGSNAAAGEFPYQVLVSFHGQFICGGSILDGTHVVTAAHCVENDPRFEPSDYPFIHDGSDFTVSYGGVDRGSPGDLTEIGVNHVSVDPRRQRRLGLDEYDSAVLTLASNILPHANTAAIPLATKGQLTGAFSASGPNDLSWITGWGDTDNMGTSPEILKKAQVPLLQDSTCSGAYGSDFTPSVMLCAGTSTTDACFGDSGGPLAVDVDPGPARNLKLAGITSFGGDKCAEANFPGVYTEVPETGTTTFLKSNPPAPPHVGGETHAFGTPRVGQRVACVTPSLPIGVHATQYFWYVFNGLSLGLFSQSGPSVVLPPVAQGNRIVCDARLENAGGYQYVEQSVASALGPVGPPLAVTPPAPAPDTTKPKASVRKIRCKHRKCTITIKAADPGGIVKRVSARVKGKYKKCRRVHGRRRCRNVNVNKKLRLSKRRGGIYVARVRLKRGKYILSVVATDAAGNRSRIAKKKFRVR